jgi:type I restriction enzyme, S subunit
LSQTLAEGWATTTLGDLSSYVTSGSRDWSKYYADHGALFVRTQDINQNTLAPTDDIARVALPQRVEGKRTLIAQGDLLITITGANVGKCALVDIPIPEAYVSQSVALVRLAKGFSGRFIQRQLTSPRSGDGRTLLQQSAYGVGRPVLNLDNVRELPICFAPLNEQTRIIAAIEGLLSGVNSARDHLSKVPAILKRFRQSVLAAACSGRLTEGWRAEHPAIESGHALAERIQQSHVAQGLGHGGQAATPSDDVHNLTQDEIPDTWAVEELKVLCQPGRSITYGILKPGPDVSGGVPYVRVADFPNNRLKLEGIRRTTKQIADMYRRSALREGDLLLSIRGTAGRVCRVPAQLDGANITQDTARISIHPVLSSAYVEHYLQCPSTQKRLEAAMKGVAVRGVNIGDVRVLQVALPPRAEQDEIVRRVDVLLKIADAIEQRLVKAIAGTDRLTQSILAKAFRGDLVPTEAEMARREGREYEPASVLLKRIRTESANHSETHALKRKLRHAAKSRRSNTVGA